MDREEMFVALSHMENSGLAAPQASEMYAETVADIAEKVSMDEMRRLLLIGAYLFNLKADRSEAKNYLWRPSKFDIQ
jgi:hypothetical protein